MKKHEMWKPINDYEGLYEVSNLGNVKSLKKAHSRRNVSIYYLKTDTFHPSGYKFVTLTKGKHRRTVAIHRLVALHFIENPENLPQVNHFFNTDKSCNEYWNLKWCTDEQNREHAILHGLHPHGDTHPRRKLNSLQVIEIRRLYENKVNTIAQIARLYSLTPGAIWSIVNFRVWKGI